MTFKLLSVIDYFTFHLALNSIYGMCYFSFNKWQYLTLFLIMLIGVEEGELV